MDFSQISLGLVVLLGHFSIDEEETDDGIIATADIKVRWIGKDEAGGTDISVRVSWVDIDVQVSWTDTDVEVSWTTPSVVISELTSVEVLEDVLVLSLVDCWQNKVLIFFDFTGFVFKLFT